MSFQEDLNILLAEYIKLEKKGKELTEKLRGIEAEKTGISDKYKDTLKKVCHYSYLDIDTMAHIIAKLLTAANASKGFKYAVMDLEVNTDNYGKSVTLKIVFPYTDINNPKAERIVVGTIPSNKADSSKEFLNCYEMEMWLNLNENAQISAENEKLITDFVLYVASYRAENQKEEITNDELFALSDTYIENLISHKIYKK